MKVLKFLASLKLAVFVILSLAVVAAVGTITEAKYNDSDAAMQLVYRSPYMYAVMGLLCINLIAVMVDRWPWQRRHTPFVLAHIGIITMLIGAFITQKQGIDGSMLLEPGGAAQQYVTVKDRELIVYSSDEITPYSFSGDAFKPVYDNDVNFLLRPPKKYPLVVSMGNESLEVIDYYHYAFRESEIVPSERDYDGPGIRFQLANDRVDVTEWIRRDRHKAYSSLNLGPARVVLSDGSYKPEAEGNEIVLAPGPDSNSLHYSIYRHGLLGKRGVVKQAQSIDTGWMGLQFRVLRLLPRARENVHFIPSDHMTEGTESAIAVRFRGEVFWAGLDSVLKLFSSDRMYIVSFGHRRVPLDFGLTLKDFRIGRDPGTTKAASYESDVDVPGKGMVTISMNQPLKWGGFTFYQASFEQDEMGKPTASILSVNYDPGRWIKYIGSLLIVAGSSMLFWFRSWFRASVPVAQAQVRKKVGVQRSAT